jgi:hypothetical protein
MLHSLSQVVYPSSRRKNLTMRVLVVTAFQNKTEFIQVAANRVLAEGLDAATNLDWNVYAPWNESPSLNGIDMVLSWPYQAYRNRFIHHGLHFECMCQSHGIPIVNSLHHFHVRHSVALNVWARNNICCPPFQLFQQVDEITLEYPLIIRTDGVHRGENMFRVNNHDEAADKVDKSQYNPEYPPINMAVKFLDTRKSQQYYRRWHSYVIGDQVLPRQLVISDSWNVHLSNAVNCEWAHQENAQFIASQDPNAQLLVQAARVIGADIAAIDYSYLPNGNIILWEANRRFDVATYGERLARYLAATGRTVEQAVADHQQIGTAIVDLLYSVAQF